MVRRYRLLVTAKNRQILVIPQVATRIGIVGCVVPDGVIQEVGIHPVDIGVERRDMG